MSLNKTERESLRKRVEIVIRQMKKSEILNHFQKEGYPQRTIYNTINHLRESIKRMESQSKTKSKLAAQLPGHLPERIS
jgi:hypothetical protein